MLIDIYYEIILLIRMYSMVPNSHLTTEEGDLGSYLRLTITGGKIMSLF